MYVDTVLYVTSGVWIRPESICEMLHVTWIGIKFILIRGVNMRLTQEQVVMVYDRICSARKVSKVGFGPEQVMRYFATINQINALEEDTHFLDNVSLDNWKVMKQFAPFIVPERISIDAHLTAINLLDTDYYKKVPVYSVVVPDGKDDKNEPKFKQMDLKPMGFHEFTLFTAELCNVLGKSESEAEAISTLRKTITLTDEIAKRGLSDDNQHVINFDNVPLKLSTKYYRDSRYNNQIEEAFTIYLKEVCLPVSKN